MKPFLILIAILGAFTVKKLKDKPTLKHFKASEFGVWWLVLDNKLLLGLDKLRELWGHPIMISPAPGSLGREGGSEKSQHYPDLNGVVRAADIMPTINGRGLNASELTQFYNLVRSMNWFSGVGVYPDWKPYPGLHLDTRTDRMADNPAKWAGIQTASGQKYIGVEEVLV